MKETETETLDRERIEKLLVAILKPIRENYTQGPQPNRDRCYEALNALAAATALIIKGAGEDQDEALEWFSDALELALSSWRPE